jgi:hypothetical protein
VTAAVDLSGMVGVSDVAYRSICEFAVGDTGRQLVLTACAVLANEDGTGIYDMPDEVLAAVGNISVQLTKRSLRWLLENGYLRKRGADSAIYDVALSEAVREEWRQSAGGPSELPIRYRPNGPDGSWVGGHPFMPGWEAMPMPQPGDYVVYFLFDHAGDICYVGKSKNFRSRVGTHAHNKTFESWLALPVSGQQEALTFETRYRNKYRPYLNIAGMQSTGEADE